MSNPQTTENQGSFPLKKVHPGPGRHPSLPDGSGLEQLTRGQNFLLASALDGTFWTLLVSSS